MNLEEPMVRKMSRRPLEMLLLVGDDLGGCLSGVC